MIRHYRGNARPLFAGGDCKLMSRAGRGLAGTVAMVLCVAVCLLGVVGGGVALALPASFGNGVGEESGQFSFNVSGIAVEQESGDVYVSDTGNERVDKFGPGGEFLFAWGWGVADGHTEAPQTCTTSCFTGLFRGGSGAFGFPQGVAVDNDPLSASYRDVYVVDTSNGRVQKFDPAGNFLLMFGGGVNETTSGDVCLSGEACRAGAAGSEPGEFERLGEGGGIAVDAAGNVFVGDLNRVQEFSPGGVSVAQIALPGAGSIGALAVDSGGDVYVRGSELSGVRKFEGCSGACSGVELGEPLDASGEFAFDAHGFVSLGVSGEVFIAEGQSGRSGHILEFDALGGEVARFDAGNEAGTWGIAFASGIGGLYVVNRGRVRVVSPPPAGPLIVSGTAGELQPTTESVNTVVNPEGHETTYHVEYGTTVAYGSSSSPAVLAGSAFEDEPVSVALSGLQSRTTYHFRIVASNSAGSAFGEDQTFTTLPPVLIDSESVSGVTATGATLAAQINPLGRDTTYRLEYGLSVAYGSSVPAPDGDAGSGTSDVQLSALVEGLTPATVYHFRVVASNSLGVVDGPDHTFTTLSAQAPVLPDGRAWEMVSPPDKLGSLLGAINSLGAVSLGGAEVQASADGSAIVYAAHAPIDAEPRGNRTIAPSEILATRTAGGWSSLDISTAHEAVTGLQKGNNAISSEYRVFSPDLSVGLVEPEGDTPLSPQATERTPYRREASGEYTPLVTAANVPPGTRFGQVPDKGTRSVGDVEFSGASSDLSHVVVRSLQPLTEGVAGPSGGSINENLFEWFGGSLRLVSVLPNTKAATEEGLDARLGIQEAAEENVRYAVSDDGSRVFWEAAAPGDVRSLYVRDVGRGETVRLDAVQPGARGGAGQPKFAVANSDGSRVFFMDESRLTADSTARLNEPDLYMCDVGVVAGKLACRLKDLTVDHNSGESADMLGTVIGAGDDGRYVYFVANGVLAAGATPGDCAEEGRNGGVCNLYVYDAVMGETRFIAQLSAKDYQDWMANFEAALIYLTAGVSPDGRYLAFMSEKSLTGYDNIDARSGQPDVEVFLYDAGTGRLTCASCNPSGARPSGVFDPGGIPGLLVDRPGNWGDHWLAGSIPGWTAVNERTAYHRSRYLSDSGRLFFDSADALVPRDANGTEDVYEYEPSGVGGCTGAGGCVGLISSGTSGEESAFLDASENGDDVFFLTAARLVPQDLDHALDVYDARVCTSSSPCLVSPPAPPVACGTADSCRAAPSSQPGVFGVPPSATFSGAGNPVPGASKPAAKKKGVSLTQKLAAALHRCNAKPKRKRASCRAQARRRYRVGVKAQQSVRSSATRKGSR
jgi:sugar lactone lactonase YvrE